MLCDIFPLLTLLVKLSNVFISLATMCFNSIYDLALLLYIGSNRLMISSFYHCGGLSKWSWIPLDNYVVSPVVRPWGTFTFVTPRSRPSVPPLALLPNYSALGVLTQWYFLHRKIRAGNRGYLISWNSFLCRQLCVLVYCISQTFTAWIRDWTINPKVTFLKNIHLFIKKKSNGYYTVFIVYMYV